jgi:hypothetical protein
MRRFVEYVRLQPRGTKLHLNQNVDAERASEAKRASGEYRKLMRQAFVRQLEGLFACQLGWLYRRKRSVTRAAEPVKEFETLRAHKLVSAVG